jgi:hypothetical protein
MNARVVLFAGMLAVSAIAFSGVFAEETGLELTASVEASCFEIPGDPACYPHPSCIVAEGLYTVTGKEYHCLM